MRWTWNKWEKRIRIYKGWISKKLSWKIRNYNRKRYIKEVDSQDIKLILEDVFEEINNRLYNQNFDIKFSGSTWVMILFIKERCFVANVGDSRAVLIKNLKQQK